jgi:hypothetical protein
MAFLVDCLLSIKINLAKEERNVLQSLDAEGQGVAAGFSDAARIASIPTTAAALLGSRCHGPDFLYSLIAFLLLMVWNPGFA